MASDKCIITVSGFACLTVIQVCALFNGIDGVLLAGVVGTIAGGMGLMLPRPSRIAERLVAN